MRRLGFLPDRRLATVTARFSPRRPVWEVCGSFQATSPRGGARRWMPCPSVTQLRHVAMLLEPFDNRGSDRVRTQCGRSGREVGGERAGIPGFADRGLQAACDRKTVVEGRRVSVRVDLGGRCLSKKKKQD